MGPSLLNWRWTETRQLSYIRDLAFDRTGIFDWNEAPRESNSSTSYEVPSKEVDTNLVRVTFFVTVTNDREGKGKSLYLGLFV